MTGSKREIPVPQVSEDFEGGELAVWHKKPGDPVGENEVVAEIMTDKVNVEVESPYNGTLSERLVEEGDQVVVGQPIARVS